ncbi:MAG TPA: hypothetical protein VLK89_07090 [Solirubrobacterales bacterium]|nr:hypothetical protein [Solirubrobacterales bacterium]
MIRGVVGILLAICAIAISPGIASGADFGILPGSLSVRASDGEGNPDDRAGAHPDRLQLGFGLNVRGTGTTARDLLFELSPGLANDANAVPACPREVFDEEEECPPDTQVGVITQTLEIGEKGESQELPLFNLEPAPLEAAAFGSNSSRKAPLSAELRPDDLGVTLAARELAQVPLGGGSVELWGIPADHQKGSTMQRRAFLTMPTRCEPLKVTLRTRSWQVGAPWMSQTAESEAPLRECKSLSFEPKLGLALSNPVSDSPTGAQIEITTPEGDGPDGRTSSQIRNVSVELPEDLSISPGAAEGMSPCSDTQFALGEATKASCPPSSRVGTVRLESPVLREALTGNLYLGAEHPGERFRILIAVSGPGVFVKLVSSLRVDPTTGRLSVVMNDLPQVPIGRMALSFDGGPHALLATPLTCGPLTSTGRFEPQGGGEPVQSSSSTSIASSPFGPQCPDPMPFAPALTAGSSDARAGRLTSFSLTMHRRDGERLLSRFSVTLPTGLSAAVGAVKLCPEPAASSGACPASSRVGSAVAELGSGPSPAAIHGGAFLTEPYRRAPFGLSLVFPARLGSFDLGQLVMRGTLRLDRRTGQVTIETDPLPQRIEGFPARIRTIGIDMDRPGFTRNPTSCEPASVNATIKAAGGASTTATTPFSLLGCDRLGFKPRFSLAMAGRSELRKRGKPGLAVLAKFPQGNTNLRTMKFAFPRVLSLATSGLKELCSRQDAETGLCADGSRVGNAYARTPLLGKPLKGGVYVAQPKGGGLPDLWFSLSAMGVHVDLRGESSQSGGRFAIKLVGLPDMPLSTFEMRLPGGPEGAFFLSAGLCAHGQARRLSSPVAASGQDGAYREMRVRVAAEPRCGGRGKVSARAAQRRAAASG